MFRTLNVSLTLVLVVEKTPRREAFHILFSQSHRFCELSPGVSVGLVLVGGCTDGPFNRLRNPAVRTSLLTHSDRQKFTYLHLVNCTGTGRYRVTSALDT